ncbi:hypothetical protein KIS4809_4607 [Bacillus sp. ZZV12-4809]|nr:hypothetical protein KIS4809_4607 [Bacillus sp. ZZV12-4809]
MCQTEGDLPADGVLAPQTGRNLGTKGVLLRESRSHRELHFHHVFPKVPNGEKKQHKRTRRFVNWMNLKHRIGKTQ